ncbi:hypothetical protein J5Y04_27595 [Kitasatospora sp. RG8]|uniref:YrhB domain-containing protein n=1 Tax=Kitasatospora sp. RG8 TaxID=2820815 RepID=UPI001ADF0EFC|nr:hypothetical protein [Kitasatospora sp. RG8]
MGGEFGWAWNVRFETQEYLDTGDPKNRPMSRALYVRKDDGTVAFLPSSLSVRQGEYFMETGVFPPPPESEL